MDQDGQHRDARQDDRCYLELGGEDSHRRPRIIWKIDTARPMVSPSASRLSWWKLSRDRMDPSL
jgi:hypothetical protein